MCACVCSYSFGCCVYEMVSGGKSPWEHLSPYEAAMKVIGGASPASLLSAGTTGHENCVCCVAVDVGSRLRWHTWNRLSSTLAQANVSVLGP